MNILKRIYCRVFQFCFKMAIPFLPYYNPQILDKVEDISEILKLEKITKVMLVTDKSIRSFGITSTLEHNLKENNIDIVLYGHTHVKSENYYPTDNGGIYTFCPGSIGEARFGGPYTYGRLQIDEKGIILSHGSINFGEL